MEHPYRRVKRLARELAEHVSAPPLAAQKRPATLEELRIQIQTATSLGFVTEVTAPGDGGVAVKFRRPVTVPWVLSR